MKKVQNEIVARPALTRVEVNVLKRVVREFTRGELSATPHEQAVLTRVFVKLKRARSPYSRTVKDRNYLWTLTLKITQRGWDDAKRGRSAPQPAYKTDAGHQNWARGAMLFKNGAPRPKSLAEVRAALGDEGVQ